MNINVIEEKKKKKKRSQGENSNSTFVSLETRKEYIWTKRIRCR